MTRIAKRGVIAAVVAVGVVMSLLVVGLVGMVSMSVTQTETPRNIPGIRPVVLDAYVQAADATPELAPECRGVRWQILAGIGKIESHHAQGHDVSEDGDVSPRILGPRLTGAGSTQYVPDTDKGHWDDDREVDRAVGPMQFLPGTWDGHGKPGSGQGMGQDGNGDAEADPHNIFDAAHAAVVHLCGTSARNLNNEDHLANALYEYNNSQDYVDEVRAAIAEYDTYNTEAPRIPDGTGDWKGPEILRAAVKWEGWPYSWGGGNEDGPSYGGCCSPSGKSGANIRGFDCSGLVIYALAQIGITGVPHRATLQWEQAESWGGTRIPGSAGIDALKPGDLMFFGDGDFFPHVGIYAGGGRMFNAAVPGTNLRYEPAARDDYYGAVRFGNPNANNNAGIDASKVEFRGSTTASYFWDDGSGRYGDTGQPASGLSMRKGMAASPSWPLHTKGYVTYNGRTMPFFVGDRGPGEPSEDGIMLDLDAKTFAELTGGQFNNNTLMIDGNGGTGHIDIDYVITEWGPGSGKRGAPVPFSTGAWAS